MIEEVKACVPEVQINDHMLYLFPDPKGMQHEETEMFRFGPIVRRWPSEPRIVPEGMELHPSVLKRMAAGAVSHSGEMKAYRPEQLKEHPAFERVQPDTPVKLSNEKDRPDS